MDDKRRCWGKIHWSHQSLQSVLASMIKSLTIGWRIPCCGRVIWISVIRMDPSTKNHNLGLHCQRK
jgi:hypothetical protein